MQRKGVIYSGIKAALCCHWLQEDAHMCPCVLRRVKAELKQIRPALFYPLLLSVLLFA